MEYKMRDKSFAQNRDYVDLGSESLIKNKVLAAV